VRRVVVEAGQQQKYRFWNNLAYAIMKITFLPFPPVHTRLDGEEDLHNPQQPTSRKATKCEMPHTVNNTLPSEGRSCLTVGLLEARAGTLTTELLGLASSVVGDEECAVVGDKSLLQLVLGVLIDELLVVGDLECALVYGPVACFCD
jgi:hypothetical protein